MPTNKKQINGSSRQRAAQDPVYGASSVRQALKGVDFPKRKQDLINQYGEETIHWERERSQQLRYILQHIQQEEFQNISDLIQAITNAIKQAGTKS